MKRLFLSILLLVLLITSIVIPGSVAYIEDNAFKGCAKLNNVYYGGSEESWNRITLFAVDIGLKSSAIIHYNYSR